MESEEKLSSTAFSHGYALLIGVGADLPITVKDATAFHGVLIDPLRAAYPSEHVQLLLETQATRQRILTGLETLIEQTKNDPVSTIIVYFSGHGGRLVQNDQRMEYFFVPYGYDPMRKGKTAISGLELTEKIEAIHAQKLIVLLDCCHAGGMTTFKAVGETFEKAPPPPELLSRLEAGSGRVIVASSRKEEVSLTGTPYSVFTTCMLEALAGVGAAQPDGYARVLSVLAYLFEQVPRRTSDKQHPFVNNIHDLDDNFPLCYYAGGKKEIPTIVPSPGTELSTTASQFDVFVTYADRDAAWVEPMAARLEDEVGLHVWLDKWLLSGGESYQQAIARGLDSAKSCAVFIGAETPTGWYQQQIEHALDRQARDPSFRVIPVLMPSAKDVNVAHFLELRVRVDFRNTDPRYALHLLVSGVKGIAPGRWPPGGSHNL